MRMKRLSSDMCNDCSGTFGGCPRAKKSKTSQEEEEADLNTNWGYLPDVVIHEIFNNLSFGDRMNASSTCKHWRQNAFHRKWWKNVTFTVEPNTLAKARFLRSAFGKIVTHVTVKLYAMSTECVEEFIDLVNILGKNTNLQSLIIEPSHCRFEFPALKMRQSEKIDDLSIVKSIKARLPYLHRFSFGCIDDLAQEVTGFLELLGSKHCYKVKVLGLASVNDDPGKCKSSFFDAALISPFKNLEILSMDYDELSDDFLNSLEGAKNLHRLVVHLHGVRVGHPGTSNAAWSDFKRVHPGCEFRLSVIHAFKDIDHLHWRVLKEEMPLSHFKVFFCESVNMVLLERLSAYYGTTLRSVLWVDSLTENENSWTVAKPFDDAPDPFVLIAWLCKRLEEIVFYGYKYWEENLIAIARLRGDGLKKLEVAEDDILFYNRDCYPYDDCYKEVPTSMKKPWKPKQKSDLHQVLRNPIEGDSDEYLLPIVLADLQ